MQALGSTVRVFTTLVMIGFDINLVFGYSLGASLNYILLFQCIFYKANTEKFMKKSKKKKPKSSAAASRTPKKAAGNGTPSRQGRASSRTPLRRAARAAVAAQRMTRSRSRKMAASQKK